MNKTIRINTQFSDKIPETYKTEEVRKMWDNLLKEVPLGTKLVKVLELQDTFYATRAGAAELANVKRGISGYAATLRACTALEKYLKKNIRKPKTLKK